MDGKYLGKVSKCRFGFDGDLRYGLHLEFIMTDPDGGSTGVNDFIGWHGADTVAVPLDVGMNAIEKQLKLLYVSKRGYWDNFVGVPVEVTIDKNLLKEWRILTEVL